jgi:HSP20 family protein
MALMHRRQESTDATPSLFDWALPTPAWFARFDELFRDGDGRQLLRVDEFEEKGKLVIRAEVPGIDPDKDVEIGVGDGALSIKVEHTEQAEEAKKEFHRKEIRYGGYYRTLPLPDGVKESDVTASYKDGILEISVPVPEETKSESRRVPVARS